MANLNAAVARSLIRSLPENLQARRARVDAYHRLLGNELGIELIRHSPGSACLTQVVRIGGKGGRGPCGKDHSGAGPSRLRSTGQLHADSLIDAYHQCVWDRLPYSDLVWPDLIDLPCEPSVAFDDLEQMTAIVKSIVAGHVGG